MPTITNAGAVPFLPTELLAKELATATTLAPGLTADLPGSLIEDLASTATGAMVVNDQAVTDLINSLSPTMANPFILYQLGQAYGVQQGIGSNTSVYVTFVSPNIGFTIIRGFVISDGTNQFIVQNGGVIEADGQSEPLFCLATNSGTFSVPVGTVTQIITSLPSTVTLMCVNQVAGIPGQTEQSIQSYQGQVVQAGQATALGVPQFIKTQLRRVVGVKAHLIAVKASGSKWEVICGGGDPYAVAYAIFTGVCNINELIGSTLIAHTITNAYGAVVTANLNHGYTSGVTIEFTGATGMSGINSVPFIVRNLTQNTFELDVAIATASWATGTATITTTEPHNLPTGTTANGKIYGMTPTAYNGTFTLTKVDSVTFTYPLASNPGTATIFGYTPFTTTSSGTYTNDSATITPNLRNVTVSINDFPDTYNIVFVNPPVQSVDIDIAWNTISTNYVSPDAIANAVAPNIVTYINAIGVGEPINIYDMQDIFRVSVASLLSANLISKILFTVIINGIVTAPVVNTGVVFGDPESYFETGLGNIVIAQV